MDIIIIDQTNTVANVIVADTIAIAQQINPGCIVIERLAGMDVSPGDTYDPVTQTFTKAAQPV
jgi:hypothetical protein